MDNETILTWNVTNWVTVILMAAIGFFLIGLALKWRQSRSSNSTGSINTTNGTMKAAT